MSFFPPSRRRAKAESSVFGNEFLKTLPIMQIGAANLLALQQAQAKTQKPQDGDFAAAMTDEVAKGFTPLFSAAGQTQPPATGQAEPPPADKPAAFQPPGSQLDIRV